MVETMVCYSSGQDDSKNLKAEILVGFLLVHGQTRQKDREKKHKTLVSEEIFTVKDSPGRMLELF